MTPRLLDWSSWYFSGAIGFDLQQTSNAIYIIHLYPCQCDHHDLHDVTSNSLLDLTAHLNLEIKVGFFLLLKQ